MVQNGVLPFSVQNELNLLQPHNYQVSKKVVHEIKFGEKAVMKI